MTAGHFTLTFSVVLATVILLVTFRMRGLKDLRHDDAASGSATSRDLAVRPMWTFAILGTVAACAAIVLPRSRWIHAALATSLYWIALLIHFVRSNKKRSPTSQVLLLPGQRALVLACVGLAAAFSIVSIALGEGPFGLMGLFSSVICGAMLSFLYRSKDPPE